MNYLAKYSVPATAEELFNLKKLLKPETKNAKDSIPFLGAVPQPATELPVHQTLPWLTWNVHGEQCMLISFQENVYVMSRDDCTVRRLSPRPFTFRTRNHSRHHKESSAELVYSHPTVVLCGILAWRRSVGQLGAPKTQQQHEHERIRTLCYMNDAGPDIAQFNAPAAGNSLVFVASDCLWSGVYFGRADLHTRLSAARSLLEKAKITQECPLHYESPAGEHARLQLVYRSCPKPFYARQISKDVPPPLVGLPVDGLQLIYPDLPRLSARLVIRRRAWAYVQTMARRVDDDAVVLLDRNNCEIGVASLHDAVRNHDLLRSTFPCAVDVRAQDDGHFEVIRVCGTSVHQGVIAGKLDCVQMQWDEPLERIVDAIYEKAAA